jgi:serine/threonine protein kinase
VPAEPLAPIAHYNLLEGIGSGGLGPLYRARDTKVGRTVALRLVPDSRFVEPADRERFLADAQAAIGLSHQNIATLFDAAAYDGGCYLAYEFASGVTLRRESGGRAMNPRRAVELGVQIAEGLSHAHARGVVHADLSPDTVFVTQKGGAKILEFGMSRWTASGQTRLRAGSAPASLGPEAIPIVSYMSPEQATGALPDHRTDLFSLGVMLREMLTGANPFAAPTAAETLAKVIGADVAPSAVAGAPSDLNAIVARATAKDIERRHQSAASLSAELRSVAAIFDVRSGDASPDVMPFGDEGGTGKWWVVAALGGAAAAALAWWMTR